MATSTELLRAAEHMRQWAESVGVDFPWRSIEAQAKRLQDIERNGGLCSGVRAFESIGGMLLHRDGRYRYRCMSCGFEGETAWPRDIPCGRKIG
jgi:hypothetical protein